ncbi:ANTAR domain-containing response regulator [Kallotenue papyrolyticum]|uniref:ANTAR domain-containing response regulator n=1 Tax=Kallotenue papyrolyticum TaxID=1325125 RepID=UPI0004785AF4|nr:response regulator [Kallotenue papyrolyticum]
MANQLRVLIAEDDPLVSVTLSDQLAELGHHVVAVASDGAEAVALARETRPDIAILDIKMPNRDGISAAEEISRELELPIVMLTAYSERALALRAAEAGALAYLLKPATIEELQAALNLAMARHRDREQLRSEVERLEETLHERELIDRAKAILMERVGLSENEAYSRMRQRAREKRVKMVQIAQTIIAAEEFLAS